MLRTGAKRERRGGGGAMSKCVIVEEKDLCRLVHRYDGIGKPITSDEREILLWALYNESKERGGIVKKARELGAYRQQFVR